MAKKKRKKCRAVKKRRSIARSQDVKVRGANELEFHRNGLVLMPVTGDRHVVVSKIQEDVAGGMRPMAGETRIGCTCGGSHKDPCNHIVNLDSLYKEMTRQTGAPPHVAFSLSRWHQLLGAIAEHDDSPAPETVIEEIIEYDVSSLGARTRSGMPLVLYLSKGDDRERFIERFALDAKQSAFKIRVPRGAYINQLIEATRTEHEEQMKQHGHRTRRQAVEESFWFRLAYHAFREFDHLEEVIFTPQVNAATGAFTCLVTAPPRDDLFQIMVPPRAVEAFAKVLDKHLHSHSLVRLDDAPVAHIRLRLDSMDNGIQIEPVIEAPGQDGETLSFAYDELRRFIYGNTVYIATLGRLARLEKPGPLSTRLGLKSRYVPEEEVPKLLEMCVPAMNANTSGGDSEVFGIPVYSRVDRLDVSPSAMERDWCWISGSYGLGDAEITLQDVMSARAKGRRFVPTTKGWVDTSAKAFRPLRRLARHWNSNMTAQSGGAVRLSRLELRTVLAVAPDESVTVLGKDDNAGALRQSIKMSLHSPLKPVKGLVSSLRDYQKRGVEWLLGLWDNGFSGLLCDDMGLGKTHQAMAFVLALFEQRAVNGRILVVCPTTVISHWVRTLTNHAPELRLSVHWGPERNLVNAIEKSNVLITSYGVLRNDAEQLKAVRFEGVIFDEIQYLKNPDTLSHTAAKRLEARFYLGLSGTPIENSIEDIKALFDLVLPGYLGTDAEFKDTFIEDDERNEQVLATDMLKRAISPFVLRRLKAAVLTELPSKIEDFRFCRLSEEQVALYREAVTLKRDRLLNAVTDKSARVPYMHIFALLNVLKQICDHPALALKCRDVYQEHESGKWELFKEILNQSLEAGHKIVVYSQYLDMLRIMAHYLDDMGVGYVKLTGKSRNRGVLVSRFQDDDACRVFIGSLKAGGVGIDLVAASVVIHYDRWWNAAKEDQATDRVHRIGQQRGVQVFKLVTEGTLEEKVSAMIEAKRKLMDEAIPEDDTRQLKVFDRDELAELLRSL